MLKRIINWQVNEQVKSGNIKEEDISVYQYGYTLMFEKLMNLVLMVMIILVTGHWQTGIVFLAAFVPLRSYAGGYHAKSVISCTVLSNAVLLMAIVVVKTIRADIALELVIEILTLIVFNRKAPVSSKNKPLLLEEQKRYKKITLKIALLEDIIGIILYLAEMKSMAFSICIAQLVGTLSVMAAESKVKSDN